MDANVDSDYGRGKHKEGPASSSARSGAALVGSSRSLRSWRVGSESCLHDVHSLFDKQIPTKSYRVCRVVVLCVALLRTGCSFDDYIQGKCSLEAVGKGIR